ncbi:MAG: GNAT family N-acetyltransferase [Bacteroidales bacterium]|nr:GNAT family N-acetyltransferase [Bacteroidales bacterium]
MEIRKACPKDVPQILEFIKGIARYEKMENEVVATENMLHEWLFQKEVAEVVFAEEDGKAAGFALYFHNFSTFVGKAGIYLEDLYVFPEHRGKGYGKALFLHLAKTALERGCGRMEWVCLNWNQPSIDFYRSMGAISLDDWKTYRLTEDALKELVY